MVTRRESQTEVAMKGDGYYSTATKGAKDVIDAATPLMLDAISEMPINADQIPFTITDMGCADGGTSLPTMHKVIAALRRRTPDKPIAVIYTDQPRNDYNALFRIVHGLTEFDSYYDAYPNVFVLASATSFYRQIVPANTLNLGFSATAMHWLSRKPGDISNHVHMVGAQGEELATFTAQAQRDWETLLLHRAGELVPGGRLVLVNFGRDEAGRYLGNTGGVNMFDTFNRLWQQLCDDGVIEHPEYVAMTLPQYYNSVAEFSAPFNDTASAVYQSGLRLERIETRVVPCPFAAKFAEHQDSANFAQEYIPTLRSWTESTFFGALSEQRPLSERREIIEQFYSSYQALVREQPQGHGMDYVHAYMTIVKQ